MAGQGRSGGGRAGTERHVAREGPATARALRSHHGGQTRRNTSYSDTVRCCVTEHRGGRYLNRAATGMRIGTRLCASSASPYSAASYTTGWRPSPADSAKGPRVKGRSVTQRRRRRGRGSGRTGRLEQARTSGRTSSSPSKLMRQHGRVLFDERRKQREAKLGVLRRENACCREH